MNNKLRKDNLFNSIYEKYKDKVYSTALNFSNNNAYIAEEISQITFLKLYIHMEHLDLTNIGAWLKMVTKNEACNRYHKMIRECPDENIIKKYDEEQYQNSPEEDLVYKEKQLENRMLGQDVLEKLYEVNPNWHNAITLAYCMDVPQANIAQEMGISLNALQALLFRARRWVEKNYGYRYESLSRE